jgi:hypothetical protein
VTLIALRMLLKFLQPLLKTVLAVIIVLERLANPFKLLPSDLNRLGHLLAQLNDLRLGINHGVTPVEQLLQLVLEPIELGFATNLAEHAIDHCCLIGVWKVQVPR